MVIAFLNQKGGVGKTTLSINIAADLANRGHSICRQARFDETLRPTSLTGDRNRSLDKVLLIDADKQGSTSTWASLRDTTLVWQWERRSDGQADLWVASSQLARVLGIHSTKPSTRY